MARRTALEEKLAAAWPPETWQEMTIVAAVSGGADSVALLRALVALKSGGAGRIVAAHFNHRLRGAEADADERFVGELCEKLGVACERGRAGQEPSTKAAGEGPEGAARHERYEFLLGTAHLLGARCVVAAHTADDQAETILQRILRGTGLAGLAGMRRSRTLGPDVLLMRPMLDVRRAEVIEYLAALGQPFCEDATNAETRFTRNRIRHDLLPALSADYGVNVPQSLIRLGQLAGEVQEIIRGLTDELRERAVKFPGTGRAVVDCRVLDRAPRYLAGELFVAIWRRMEWPQQDYGMAEWQALAEMAAGSGGAPRKRMFPGSIVAERQWDELILSKATP